MALPPRRYFSLEEVADAWGVTTRTLVEHASEDALQVGVRLFGITAEVHLGTVSQAERGPALERRFITGAVAIFTEDLVTMLWQGTVRVRRFLCEESDRWLCLVDTEADQEITLPKLVITASERARCEQAFGLVSEDDSSTPPAFAHTADYRAITLDGQSYVLSTTRAALIRVFHEAWLSGQPWLPMKGALEQAGSESTRLVDVFGPMPGWRKILLCDRCGNWRLNLPDRPERHVAFRRLFRRPSLRLVK
jgi:predicted secreted protein